MNSLKSNPILSNSTVARFIVPFAILANVGITIPLAYFLNIWLDEAFSLLTTDGSLGSTIKRAIFFELQPPLYFVVLTIWRNVNGSLFFARLFSILCVAATIFLSAKVSSRYLGKIHPGWLCLSIAVNPFAIWTAVEARCYAWVLLLSVLLILLFYDGYLSPSTSSKARWIYVLFAILAIYTQYYLGFLLVANMIVLLVLRRWQASSSYILGMIVVGICFSPMLLFLQDQVADAISVNNQISMLKGLKSIYWKIQDYIFFVPSDPKGWTWLAVIRDWIFKLGIVAALILLVKQYRSFTTPAHIAILTIFGVLCVCFLFLVTQLLEPESFRLRHAAVLFLPSFLIVFLWVSNCLERRHLVLWMTLYLVFNITTLFIAYSPMAKPGNHAHVAAYIQQSDNIGRPILVFPSTIELSLQFHYSGPGKIIPIPGRQQFDFYNPHDYVLQSEEEIFQALSKVPGSYDYFWLVLGETAKIAGVDINRGVMKEFISKYCSVSHTKRFYRGITVYLLRLHDKDEGKVRSTSWSSCHVT